MRLSFGTFSLLMLLGGVSVDAIATNAIPLVGAEQLSVRGAVLNPVGGPGQTYEIDGRSLKLQNVSGDGQDCFFNSTGLNRAEQVQRIIDNLNDPFVRNCIANDIFLGVDTKVKENHAFSQQDIANITGLVEFQHSYGAAEAHYGAGNRELGNALHGENRLSFIHTLLGNEDALKWYTNTYLATGTSMNIQSNLHEANFYTAVDAIAHLNNFRLRAYRLNREGGLDLFHQYTPANAGTVTYIYHSGGHFQALIPVAAPQTIAAPVAPSPVIENSPAIAAQAYMLEQFSKAKIAQEAGTIGKPPASTPTAQPVPQTYVTTPRIETTPANLVVPKPPLQAAIANPLVEPSVRKNSPSSISPPSKASAFQGIELPSGCTHDSLTNTLRITKTIDASSHVFTAPNYSIVDGEVVLATIMHGITIKNVSIKSFQGNKWHKAI